ncbi:hypothetical protein SMB34_12965 [Thalassospira permensis NBRC 106175]|uniref:Uncharacterized protein n=1 Tax=Thalassospira permensis NBRC 106175 TaxID=1353532 RepID=A0ABR4TS52_9PROT|nr:hypothetical protein SMB34_12965 [Thalassospira permensis NBRC 106175]
MYLAVCHWFAPRGVEGKLIRFLANFNPSKLAILRMCNIS